LKKTQNERVWGGGRQGNITQERIIGFKKESGEERQKGGTIDRRKGGYLGELT